MSETNWLKIATEAEQAAESAQQGAQQAANAVAGYPGVQGAKPAAEESPKTSPQATPEPAQKAEQGKQQRSEIGMMRQAVPDAANRALPALNESLHYLTTELLSRDDMRLPEPAARGLAIEIMAAWLAASRQGTVSELGSIVAKSSRISAVLDTVQ